MDSEQTNQTSDNQELITELHAALNAVTALFVSFHGADYHCIGRALQALEKSGRIHNLPVREILAQRIDRKEAQS